MHAYVRTFWYVHLLIEPSIRTWALFRVIGEIDQGDNDIIQRDDIYCISVAIGWRYLKRCFKLITICWTMGEKCHSYTDSQITITYVEFWKTDCEAVQLFVFCTVKTDRLKQPKQRSLVKITNWLKQPIYIKMTIKIGNFNW